MLRLSEQGAYIVNGRPVPASQAEAQQPALFSSKNRAEASLKTMAAQILKAHSIGGGTGDGPLSLRFDCLASHDITYVGIIQTLRASNPDLKAFPVPYVLSNCHNSLCAVGGTINADDHAFGLSAAKKYGAVFVPPHIAVIHQYMREMMAGCGKMILGSDSHTRYGPLGAMGFGEGGGELVKQLLGRGYDIARPEVIGCFLTGGPRPGVGPQDVALAVIKAVFENGYVKNKIMEFFGGGVARLSVDFRNGIDVMTTETACLSSIWITDEAVREYYHAHGRETDYQELMPGDGAYYDGLIEVDLSSIKPMIALPFHPSNAYEIDELINNISDIAESTGSAFPLNDMLTDGKPRFSQCVIAGCAGGLYENICAAASILGDDGSYANLSVYPASQPVYLSLTENGVTAKLMRAGAVLKTAFCGPCFGAGDIPAHQGLSARHATRNFPNREGSKPNSGQSAYVALMDARSIAATAKNGGFLTAAPEEGYTAPRYFFDKSVYASCVYNGVPRPDTSQNLIFGPGIRDWPALPPLSENILMQVAAFITDPVTTTDELIPSGETSSFRSNPLALAEFTLSRKEPCYVARAKAVLEAEKRRRNGEGFPSGEIGGACLTIERFFPGALDKLAFASVIYAVKPGDGSAREQAASCQRVLGGIANIAAEYATKRYRSNLINWGMIPFILKVKPDFNTGDLIFIPGIREAVARRSENVTAYLLRETPIEFALSLPAMTENEAEIILSGGLINYYFEKRA